MNLHEIGNIIALNNFNFLLIGLIPHPDLFPSELVNNYFFLHLHLFMNPLAILILQLPDFFDRAHRDFVILIQILGIEIRIIPDDFVLFCLAQLFVSFHQPLERDDVSDDVFKKI